MPRPPFAVVVIMLVAPLFIVVVAAIGLLTLSRLADQLRAEPPAPAPARPCSEAAPAPPISLPPQPRGPTLRALSVRDDAVEIDLGHVRHELPGYPPPRSEDHPPGQLTTAVMAPRDDLVAVAGICHGKSGVTEPAAPTCAPVFVRLYRAADGRHVRDLALPWDDRTADRRRAVALAFDSRAERLAVLVGTSWSDCSWGGDYVELFVYRLSDGARVARRTLAKADTGGTRTLTFHEDEVHVRTVRADARAAVRVVRLRARPVERVRR